MTLSHRARSHFIGLSDLGVRMLRTLLITSLLCLLGADAAPTSRPVAIDPAMWQRMLAIDVKAADVKDLTADFEQQKFTAMLKKPLVSSGRIFVRGSEMLWDTRKPEPTQLAITAKDARIYYPSQKTIEVYQLQEKLSQIAASPLPRLANLLELFTFEPLAISEMGASDEKKFLAVKMTPIAADLKEHVDQVRVLLNGDTGLIESLEMRDPDGDRTVMKFSHPKINSGLKDADLQIDAPGDVKITHPLAAVEGQQAQDPKR